MASVSGGQRIEEALRAIGARIGKAREVRVGFLEPEAATIAALNNFGAPGAGIPPRPFFSDMVDAKSPGWGDQFGKVLKSTGNDSSLALDLMGASIAGQLREAIENFTEVPNSPVTDLLKNRFPMRDNMTFADVQKARNDVANGKVAPPGKPLVWTGHMLRSVDQEVT